MKEKAIITEKTEITETSIVKKQQNQQTTHDILTQFKHRKHRIPSCKDTKHSLISQKNSSKQCKPEQNSSENAVIY